MPVKLAFLSDYGYNVRSQWLLDGILRFCSDDTITWTHQAWIQVRYSTTLRAERRRLPFPLDPPLPDFALPLPDLALPLPDLGLPLPDLGLPLPDLALPPLPDLGRFLPVSRRLPLPLLPPLPDLLPPFPDLGLPPFPDLGLPLPDFGNCRPVYRVQSSMEL